MRVDLGTGSGTLGGWRRGRIVRPLRALVGWALFCVLVSVGASPSPAGAHAELSSTNPASDSVVDEAPKFLEMTFTESVSVASSGVRVFDPNGQPVEVTATAEGSTVRVPFPADAARGTWTVAWSMISGDGHPINGAWVFHLGERRGGADVADLNSASSSVKWLRVAARAALLLALMTLIAPLLWKPISPHAEVIATGVVWIGLAGLAVADGLNISRAGNPPFGEVLRIWLSTKSGLLIAIAAGLTLIAHVLTLGTEIRRRAIAGAWLAVLVAVVLSGHAAILPPVIASAVLTPVHVIAALVWAAGVVSLELNWPPSSAEVGGLTRLGGPAVVVVAVSGIILVLIRTPLDELLTSAYGRIGLAKVAILVGVLVLAGVNRFKLGPEAGEAGEAEESWVASTRMRSVVRVEASLLIGLVIVGAVLSSTAPPPMQREVSSTAEDGSAVTFDAEFGRYAVNVRLTPGAVGTNEVRIEVIDPATGQAPTDLSELKVSLTQEVLGLGPLEAVAEDPESAQLVAGFDLTAQGRWRITVDGRVGRFEFLRGTIDANL